MKLFHNFRSLPVYIRKLVCLFAVDFAHPDSVGCRDIRSEAAPASVSREGGGGGALPGGVLNPYRMRTREVLRSRPYLRPVGDAVLSARLGSVSRRLVKGGVTLARVGGATRPSVEPLR